MWEEKSKYPLSWPEQWPRTNPSNRAVSRFGVRTVAVAFSFLIAEVKRLAPGQCFMSSNIPRTKQGEGPPLSNYKQPTDPGVAVYFALNGKPVCLACDKWVHVEDNIWSIAKHIEALRGQDRWGVGTLEQAFRGYMALPGIGQASGINWWEVLGVPVNADETLIKEAYRLLAKKHHPDMKNGERERWDRIQQAYEQAERMFQKA